MRNTVLEKQGKQSSKWISFKKGKKFQEQKLQYFFGEKDFVANSESETDRVALSNKLKRSSF